ncbi:MAG: metallophosphoesterase [Clostridia bacterium]|nr:metallophosphoesterase [Clostridia bacterium]
MSIIPTSLKIGVKTPFRALHMTDTHLTYADLRDGERKVQLAERRARSFPRAAEMLQLAAEVSKSENVPILHTGDLIDFVSLANLEAVEQFIAQNDCFFATGNHEFSLYVGEAKEDAAYRNQSLPAVQKVFKNDIRMASRVIGGVNFVALDNGYYLFEPQQLVFLKNEVQRGLPVVLLLHNPLYEPKLHDLMMQHDSCSYLVAVPEALMASYSAHRFEQQRADAITLEAVEYIKNETQIKAIIAGHLHKDYEGVFGDRIPQIVTSCTKLRLIEFT